MRRATFRKWFCQHISVGRFSLVKSSKLTHSSLFYHSTAISTFGLDIISDVFLETKTCVKVVYEGIAKLAFTSKVLYVFRFAYTHGSNELNS